ncbi:hypothetical protein F183_A00630 [Bryobacterales bacterium F-183]|nr:hypothetical protein F183_A00630 [Bryobacterales bacterium F-183]
MRWVLLRLLASAFFAGAAVYVEGGASEVTIRASALGISGVVIAAVALWGARTRLTNMSERGASVFVAIVLPLATALLLDAIGYSIEMRGIAYATFAVWSLLLWIGALGLTVLFVLRRQ